MSNTFDPEAYLLLAETLASMTPEEPCLRAAVSRAYYAAFLVAREKRPVEGKARVHERVRQEYGDDHAGIASRLGTMCRVRETADYDLSPEQRLSDWEANWQQTLKNAVYVIEEVKKL